MGADRFPNLSFQLKQWRGDKITGAGRYAESNKDPDMEVDLVLGQRHYPFAVECKWRAQLGSGETKFAEPYQIENYRAFMRRTERPVFIVLGVGGMPSDPSALFVIPLKHAADGTLKSAELLSLYTQPMYRKAGFYYDIVHKSLKL